MSQLSPLPSLFKTLLYTSAITVLTLPTLVNPGWTAQEPVSAPEESTETLPDNPKATVDEVWQLVNNEFVDRSFHQVNWQRKRQELLSRSYTNSGQAYKAIREALKELGDPYTRFLDPQEFGVLTSQTSGELTGVGIRLTFDKRTSDLIIVDVLKKSPAMEGGIQVGDRLVRINGKPTALMNLEQASEELKGEIGSDVNIQLTRKGKGVFDVKLTRAQIEIPSVTYTLKEEGKMRIGYIKLDEFSSHAAEQMKLAIEQLHQDRVSGYVLDLRGNPGGLLFSSVDIARMWMKQGRIVSTIDRRGGDRQFSANNTAITDLPLVVLVDEGSASASEILAGALKENGRAMLVGTSTYGKSTVQSVHSLEDGSGLAVTIARYYPPSGINLSKVGGVKPDVQIELTMEQQVQLRNDPSLLATPADPQYIRAITVLNQRGGSNLNLAPKPVGIRP
jgi:carboxyl-terminal processing protease